MMRRTAPAVSLNPYPTDIPPAHPTLKEYKARAAVFALESRIKLRRLVNPSTTVKKFDAKGLTRFLR